MIFNIKKISSTLFFVSLYFYLSSQIALAGSLFNNSLQETGEKTGHNPNVDSNSIYEMIANVIKIALGLVGIIFIILIIYAGFTWMLARGDETEANKAKSTIERATVGLLIILSAYAITAFVGNQF